MARTKAPAADTPAKAPAAKKAAAPATAEARRPRGWLADAVLAVVRDFASGKLVLPEGQGLTPHRVAKLVQERDGSEDPPSTGAVSAVFKRWEDYGFAKFTQKPFGFKALTPKGEELGLEGLILGRREKRKVEHAKAKKAAAKAEAAA